MSLTRQDFLVASAAVAAAFGLQGAAALARESGHSVIWLRGHSCSGCSVSLLDAICYDTIDGLFQDEEDLKFLGEGLRASRVARTAGNSVLVVEGAVPVGSSGGQCYLWPGLTAANGIKIFASRTPHVIAVGDCAFCGDVAAQPNKAQVVSVQTLLGPSKRVINLPGCPIDPDWLVGTIAYLLKYGSPPALDAAGRPTVSSTHARGLWPLPHLSRPDIRYKSVA